MKWVLGRQPDNEEAAALQQQAQLGLAQILTPQPMVTLAPTTTPTVMPTITPTPAPVTDPDSELTRIEELIDDEVWEDVISSLINFQQQFPSHKRPHTDELLYESYIALGLSLMDGEQVELGMYYLSQARRLGDLPIEAVDYETWAELYLQGIAFYGTNWGASAYYFRDLCLAAPFYQNSCDRLLEVLEAYGDQYAFVLDWCPAQELYAEAQQHQRTQAIVTKLAEAREGCLQFIEDGLRVRLGAVVDNENATDLCTERRGGSARLGAAVVADDHRKNVSRVHPRVARSCRMSGPVRSSGPAAGSVVR
jgi:hypothetical protein